MRWPVRREGAIAMGYTVRLAAAPTPAGAEWLARAGVERAVQTPDALCEALGALELTALDWPADALDTLAAWGVRTARPGTARNTAR